MTALTTQRTDYICYQSDALILKLGRFVWPIHAISAVLLMSLLFAYAPLQRLLPWAGWTIVLSLVQGFACFYGAHLFIQQKSLRRVSRVFDSTAILLAISWMWFALALVPGTGSDLRNFIGFILGGAVLTLTGTQNLHFRIMAISTTLIVGSRIYRLFTDSDGRYGLYSALMLFIFLMLMLGLGLMLKRFTQNGFALQWDKSRLAEELEAQATSLKIARAEADAANKAKSMFLAQASHDLRQPLHAMGLHMASLQGEEMTPKTGAVMERLEQSVEVLSKLFNSLLDVTLLDTHQLVPKPVGFDVGALVHEIADEFAIAAKAENMKVTARSSQALIVSDPLLVRRILQNLVSNAIRHSEGGEVMIETAQKSEMITLLIKDTGKGIPQKQKVRMFEEFAKGKASHTGLGLGLAIVRRLVDVLGIEVHVTSDKITGTEFSIGPFAVTQSIETKPHDVPPLSSREAGRVLVIDDDRATLEATGALLSSWGWDIDARVQLDGNELPKMKPIDLIIADFELGFEQTGLAIVAAVRKKYGPVPALIVTGSSTPATRQQILNEGCLLLHKPVRPVQLRSAIISVYG